MILRITAMPFLVCWWCVAQATQNSGELDRRLGLVEAERSRGSLATAESMLTEVQAEIEQRQDSNLLVAALREHGLLRDDAGRPEEAISFYERALAVARAQPDTAAVTIGLLIANLASSRADHGDSEQALSLSTESMTLLSATVERSDPAFAVALYAYGTALHSIGRNTEALRDEREALDIWRHAAEPEYAQVALVNESVALCLADLGYIKQAEAFEREALSLREAHLALNSLGIAASLNNLGVILARGQRFAEARQLLEKAAFLLEQCGDSEQRRLTSVLGNLGGVYYSQAQNSQPLYAKAEEIYRRKLALDEQQLGPSDVRVAATLEMLGEVLYRERAYNEAGQIYGRGLAIQQAAFGPSDPKTQSATKRYNALVKKMKAGPAR